MSVKKTDVMRYVKTTSSLPDAEGLLVGYFVSNGTLDVDGFTELMAANRPNMDQASAKMMLSALFNVVASGMAAYPCRYSLGPVAFEPQVSGSAPAVNSPLSEGQRVGVAVRLDGKLRNCLSDIVPMCVSQEYGDIRLLRVMDEASETAKVIDGTKPFVLSGLNIKSSGEGEGIRVVHDNGEEAEAQVVSESGTGQRIVAHLVTALPAGKARICLTTHGFGVAEGPGLVPLELGVAILAGETPPEPPTPTNPTVTSINSGTFWAGSNTVYGTGMRFADANPASHVVIKDDEGQVMELGIENDTGVPASETGFGLIITEDTPLADGAEYTFEFSMLDAEGEPTTVTKTACWHAE